jgi:hypothetical protein
VDKKEEDEQQEDSLLFPFWKVFASDAHWMPLTHIPSSEDSFQQRTFKFMKNVR